MVLLAQTGHRTEAPLPRIRLDVPLETKLHAPSVREEWIERSELIRHMAETTARLVLVDAPPGFGKTTLVAQWRARSGDGRRFAWISLDRGDNDPARLWWHVVSALQRACPELTRRDILQPLVSNVPDLASTLIPVLVNELAALRTPVVLVLDDYHVIKEPSCHEQIELLLLRLPSSARLVLATRADPPLPLARLRAAGDMTEIRMRELRFTASEVAALVYATTGLSLSGADVANLMERTEGWPAGAYLAALSLRGSKEPSAFVRQFTGNNRFIVDFLAEEVLNRQPPAVRQFLMRTSILERFTAPLCDAVTGISNSAQVIERIEHENLFLIPLDDNRTWFRYHHLFAQMLRSQLARAEPEIVPALHQRASAWHRTQGLTEAAVGHALSAGDIPGVVDLIARSWLAFVYAGRAAEVADWLRWLGDDVLAEDPVAAHCATWVAALRGDRQSAQRWLALVESGQHDGPLPDGMKSLRSSAALFRGTFGFGGLRVMRESAAAAVELEDDPASPWYALAQIVYGYSLYLSGEPGATAAFEQAVLSEPAMAMLRIMALAGASFLAADEGRVTQAQELADAAGRITADDDLGEPQQSWLVPTAAGAVHYQQHRLAEARTDFERALRARSGLWGISPWPAVDILLRLAAVHIELGDRAEAAALLTEVKSVLTAMPEGTGALQARLSGLQRLLAGAPLTTPATEPLTAREEAVLRLLRGTLSLREIGQELYLSANTIKSHTRAIYRKLGVSTRHDAVERARQSGTLL